MIDIGRCNQLLDSGFSIITVGEEKKPNISWKPFQSRAATKEEFLKNYKKSTTKNVGIVTGYNNLECLDIDLKVLPTLSAQQDFWKEFISFVRDNIDDFDAKFCIYKTVNNGYHILYRCEEIEGNKKLAKLEGQTEAIFETRGIGGYVFVYDRQVGLLDYTQIQEISVKEREILLECARFYDYQEPQDDAPKVREEYQPEPNRVSTWEDYNAKTNILDLLSDEMSVVRANQKHIVVKRHGANSPHSGYVYRDSGCLYLFSTGTAYPAEELLTPFAVYAYKYFRGDFSAAAKELYAQGFGDRKVKKQKVVIDKPEIKDLDFPLEVFPEGIQEYIVRSAETLSLSVDYMACSLLWLLSVTVGNSLEIEIKSGWREKGVLWLALVGRAGVGKTPSITQIIKPLERVNNREIKRYQNELTKYEKYLSLSKEEKQTTEEIKKPRKTQFIVNDITLEALVEVHQESKNAIGVFKDELAGWFKDMNKYRAGSDLEFHLSSWSGKAVSMNRKTAKSSFVEFPFIPVLGGIQPSILEKFNTEDYRESGFLDRLLICYPEISVDFYSEEELNKSLLTWYNDVILDLYNNVERHLVRYDENQEIEPHTLKFSEEARKEWISAFNEITKLQNSDEESEFYKTMLPKQKSYIPRFALLIHCIDAFFNDYTFNTIRKSSVEKARKVSKYFIGHAKKVKADAQESKAIRKASANTEDPFEKFVAVYEMNPEANRQKIADLLEVSRQTVYNWIKKYKKERG